MNKHKKAEGKYTQVHLPSAFRPWSVSENCFPVALIESVKQKAIDKTLSIASNTQNLHAENKQ